MDTEARRKILAALEQALANIRDAHRLALRHCQPGQLGEFHLRAARIADEIDQELIAALPATETAAPGEANGR